jgi:hypothetical protein
MKELEVIQKNKFYPLELEKLDEVINTMKKQDCIIQVGSGNEQDGGTDKFTLHIYWCEYGYRLLFYTPNEKDRQKTLKTKKGALNRIKKYIENGDISPTYFYFG